jgi:hypothetical protein
VSVPVPLKIKFPPVLKLEPVDRVPAETVILPFGTLSVPSYTVTEDAVLETLKEPLIERLPIVDTEPPEAESEFETVTFEFADKEPEETFKSPVIDKLEVTFSVPPLMVTVPEDEAVLFKLRVPPEIVAPGNVAGLFTVNEPPETVKAVLTFNVSIVALAPVTDNCGGLNGQKPIVPKFKVADVTLMLLLAGL